MHQGTCPQGWVTRQQSGRKGPLDGRVLVGLSWEEASSKREVAVELQLPSKYNMQNVVRKQLSNVATGPKGLDYVWWGSQRIND